MSTMEVTISDEDGEDLTVALPAKWIICEHCSGEGKSSSHLGAFTASDMEEEGDEFREDYMRGFYDKTCDHCNGAGKELVPDLEQCTRAEHHAALEYLEQEANERAQERRIQYMESGGRDY